MRQAKQEFDWGILIIIAMSLAIAWTFLINSELPAGHDLEHYVFQATDIETGFTEGVFYPRWSPHTLKGYGAPIPNYYPVGASYTIATISALLTNDIFQATRLVFVLAYVVAGLGVYLYLSRRTDSAIGLLGSVLYLYSPMIGSTIPYVMGDIALLIASGLLPLSLWSSYRLTSQYNASDILFYPLLTGFLIWVHPQTAVLSLLVTTLVTLFEHMDTPRLRRTIRLLSGHILGILLVTFFWMPALFEHDLVDWYPVIQLPIPTLSLDQLLMPMQQIDVGLLMPQPQFKLGWILLGFFSIGCIVIFRERDLNRYLSIFIFSVCLLLTGVGVFVLPQQTWLLAPITLFMSIIGAHTLYLRRYLSPARRRLLLTASIAATIIFSQPVWLAPQPNMLLSTADAISQIRYEQQGYGYPTLTGNHPLPTTIPPTTEQNRALINSFTLNSPQRYDDTQNNADTILSLLSTTSHQQVYRIFNRFPTELEFILPYFAGWQAYIDGEAIPTYANPDNGQLKIDVPVELEGELTITLGGTRIRSLAWLTSLFTVILVLLVAFVRGSNINDDTKATLIETLPRTDIRLILVMFVSLGIIILALVADNPVIQLQRPETFSISQSLPLQSRTSAGLEASTFTLNNAQVSPNEAVQLTVYWQALTDIPLNYYSRVRLRNASNNVIEYLGELQPIGTVPTRRWERNKFVSDTHVITIPEAFNAGDYIITLDAFPCQKNCDFDNPLTFFDVDGNSVGRELTIPLSISVR